MVMEVGISVQRRANLTGVTSSCGSRSTWAWSMRRQKEARRSKGSVSSIMHRKMSSMSSCLEISSMARYWRSRHIRAKSFSWYLTKEDDKFSELFFLQLTFFNLNLWQKNTNEPPWGWALCMRLPVVGEDVLIVSVSLSCLLSQMSDALLLFLVGLVRPHQPHLQQQQTDIKISSVHKFWVNKSTQLKANTVTEWWCSRLPRPRLRSRPSPGILPERHQGATLWAHDAWMDEKQEVKWLLTLIQRTTATCVEFHVKHY